jgi:hypothetical protein
MLFEIILGVIVATYLIMVGLHYLKFKQVSLTPWKGLFKDQ